jgi:phosphoribosylanthranilate isomerase
VVRIKVCGVTDTTTALAAAWAGADFVGLVFAPSRRQVSPEQARLVAETVRSLKPRPLLVGVFANAPINEVNHTAELCLMDVVQLSGNEDWQYCRKVKSPIIKTIHISMRTTMAQVITEIEQGYRLFSHDGLTFLLDTAASGAWGGTGRTFDWRLARRIAANFPFLVAGGLDPDNVGWLVGCVDPWGVDVSTGVETAGVKDEAKIRVFIGVARQAERELGQRNKRSDDVSR